VVGIVVLLLPTLQMQMQMLILIYPCYGCPVDKNVLLQIPSLQIQMTMLKQSEAGAILH
jgi:hypothetical protein